MSCNEVYAIVERIDTSKRRIGRSAYSSASENNEKDFLKWLNKISPDLENSLSGYIAFSKIANGLNYNGLFIYSITPGDKHSIYSTNEEWWDVEEQKKYLFFADDSISWYCQEISSGAFYVLDRPSGEKMEQHQTFDELLCSALNAAL